jgi:hypothetical protein
MTPRQKAADIYKQYNQLPLKHKVIKDLCYYFCEEMIMVETWVYQDKWLIMNFEGKWSWKDYWIEVKREILMIK